MATGSGKTFTAANVSYRLLRHANAKRILFLVDRANLGRQAIREFEGFDTPDDGRKFTELYNARRLSSSQLDMADEAATKVHVSTIQRIYSILRGEELDDDIDEQSGFDMTPDRPTSGRRQLQSSRGRLELRLGLHQFPCPVRARFQRRPGQRHRVRPRPRCKAARRTGPRRVTDRMPTPSRR